MGDQEGIGFHTNLSNWKRNCKFWEIARLGGKFIKVMFLLGFQAAEVNYGSLVF